MPSDKHEELKAKALKWIGSRATGKGIRAATEVKLDTNYVADVVALCNLQHQHLDRFAWTNKKYKQQPLGPFACIFECKVSRTDYLNTFNWLGESGKHAQARRHPAGNLHFIVLSKEAHTEMNLYNETQVGKYWGVLVERSGGLSMERKPEWAGHGYVDWDTINKRVLWGMDSSAMHSLLRHVNVEGQ